MKKRSTRRTARLGPEHVDTLRSRLALARSYAILNRFDDALKLDQQTVALMEAKLGPEHSETLQAMNNLAQDYRDLRRFDDAVKLLEKTLAIQQRTLGRDHLETLGGMIRLANAYNDLGQHAKAVKLREEALVLQKLKLPADHPDLLTSMYTLANGYGFLERYSDALKLHKEVLERRKAKFGPDHPSVLWSTWGVTAQFFKLNRGDEALPMIEEVVERAVRLKVQPDLDRPLEQPASVFPAGERCRGLQKNRGVMGETPSYRPSKSLQRRLLSGCRRRRHSCLGQVSGGRPGGPRRSGSGHGLASAGHRGWLRQRGPDEEGLRSRRAPRPRGFSKAACGARSSRRRSVKRVSPGSLRRNARAVCDRLAHKTWRRRRVPGTPIS